MAADVMRDRILALVRRYPGLHLREVARQLDTSVALVEYHVPALLDEGLLERLESEGTHRLFPAHEGFPRQALAAIRDAKRLHIVLCLMEHGAMRHTTLVEKTGYGKSTLSFHLKRLMAAGVVRKKDTEYDLVDAAVTRRLLDRHRPTPDLTDRFGRIWGDLYG